MTDTAISPLRRRMIEDMTIRQFKASTQHTPMFASSRISRSSSRLFRRLCLQQLAAAHDAGRLQFFTVHAALADTRAFAAYLAPLHDAEWVVYAKNPSADPSRCCATWRATPIGSPSPTADSSPSTTKASHSNGRTIGSTDRNVSR